MKLFMHLDSFCIKVIIKGAMLTEKEAHIQYGQKDFYQTTSICSLIRPSMIHNKLQEIL